jgi:hypothetical protein
MLCRLRDFEDSRFGATTTRGAAIAPFVELADARHFAWTLATVLSILVSVVVAAFCTSKL